MQRNASRKSLVVLFSYQLAATNQQSSIMFYLWVYVFYGFYVGLAKLHFGATPPSVMALLKLNSINSVSKCVVVSCTLVWCQAAVQRDGRIWPFGSTTECDRHNTSVTHRFGFESIAMMITKSQDDIHFASRLKK